MSKRRVGIILIAVIVAAGWLSVYARAGVRPLGGPRPDQIARGVSIWRKGETTGPYLKETETITRPRILLNGVWQFSNAKKLPALNPFDKKQLKNPRDAFPAPPTNEKPPEGGWQDVLIPSAAGYVIADPGAYRRGLDWYRRKFRVPDAWKGKRVILRFDSIFYEPVLYINGRYVAWTRIDLMPWQVDITKFVRFGRENDLDLRLRYAYRVYGKAWLNAFIGDVRSTRVGILSNVFLMARPSVSTRNVFIKPSFRKKSLTVDYELGNAGKKIVIVRVESFVTDLAGKKVMELPELKATLAPGTVTRLSDTGRWEHPRLWSPADPYLYLLETRLYSKSGRQLIDIQKERFGFREVWIKDGEFYVNGNVVQFNQDSIYPQSPVGDRRVIAAQMRRIKAFGYNMIRYFDKPYSLDLEIADEVGIYVKDQSGWHHPSVPMNWAFKKDALVQVPRWIRRDRNHPSVVMWSSENEAFTTLLKARKLVFNLIRQTDPTRPIDTEGGYGANFYDETGKVRKGPLVDWMDIINPHYPGLFSRHDSLLSQAEMPVEWSKTKPKPLFFGEWGNITKSGRLSRPARHFEDLFHLTKPAWFSLEGTAPGYVDYMEFVWPYWSRLGVGGQENYDRGSFMMFAPVPHRGDFPTVEKRDYIPMSWERLDTLGTKTNYYRYYCSGVNPGFFPSLPVYELSKLDKRFARLFRPFYAFFPDRTYSVYAGTIFARELSLLNRSAADATIKGKAELLIDNKVVASSPFKATVPQGRFRAVMIRFSLPEVSRRSEAKVEVVLDMKAEKWGSQPLKLALFPKLASPPATRVLLYDPQGTTKSALLKLGFRVRSTDLKGGYLNRADVDVLVIGHHDLDRTVAGASRKILSFVKDGGRVLCLAQKADNVVKWVPVALYRDRNLYVPQVVRLSDKKRLFQGLKADDLSFWPNGRDNPDSVVGTVSRYPYKEPKAGRIRSLLECGEKFNRSALLELRHGKGLIWLSQLEMVPVVGISPVADILLRRLISTPADTLPTRQVWYAGDRRGLLFLKNSLGIELKRLAESGKHMWSPADLIVWMPGGATISERTGEIAGQALKKGAALLAFVPQRDTLPSGISSPPLYGPAMEYKNQVYVVQVRKPRGYRGPAGRFIKMALVDRDSSLTRGLSNAQFFRPSARGGIVKLADYEIIGGKNGWKTLARPGVIAWRQQGKSLQVILTIVRSPGKKIQGPYRYILHELLTNMGAVSRDPKVLLLEEFAKSSFTTVNLRPYSNVGFRDEKEGDHKGGFSDQGARNLGNLPTGKQTFNGIPYDIIVPAKNGGKSCIELGFKGVLDWLPKQVPDIKVGGQKARDVYFLHTASWARTGLLGYYIISYSSVSEQQRKIPILGGINIADWSAGADLPEAPIAWTGIAESGNRVSIYSYRWKNPLPDIPIESIDFRGKFRSSLGLIAITLGQ